MRLGDFSRFDAPFPHWICSNFISSDTVRAINAEWPGQGFPGWRHEAGSKSVKSSLLFPARLPPVAQGVAEALFAPPELARLSEITGIDLLPDPWFTDGPTVPRLGGGLHEIHAGGRLGIHLDFNQHPSGLTRCLNLLVYLNEDWDASWGGALELAGSREAPPEKTIYPFGGMAVMFRTTDSSWHGHPRPLACPKQRSRRSLALYYYRREADPTVRPTTVYR